MYIDTTLGIPLNIYRYDYVGIFEHRMINYYSQTLVAETLVLAKTHGYVEKIENELEEEILQETYLPKEDFVR
jgi:hypothetical protein